MQCVAVWGMTVKDLGLHPFQTDDDYTTYQHERRFDAVSVEEAKRYVHRAVANDEKMDSLTENGDCPPIWHAWSHSSPVAWEIAQNTKYSLKLSQMHPLSDNQFIQAGIILYWRFMEQTDS